MIWLLSFSLLAYAWVVLRRLVAWVRMAVTALPDNYTPVTSISVIIPVRNEAANIVALLQDLEAQQYPKELFEVLIVDDHSTDDTLKLIHQYNSGSTMSSSVLELKHVAGLSMKKAAVKYGVEQAKGELLVLTDGDCRVGPEWLKQYAYTYETKQPYFISGPVCLQNTYTTFERMQLVEFASLIGIGGASMAINRPNMCNGANLAYPKHVFEQVGGFTGNDGIASGDDEFLLHKIHQQNPGKAVFLKSPEAVVYTEARKNLVSFMSQRIRWASKWRAYQSVQVQLVALIVFLVNFLLFLSIPFFLFGHLPLLVFLGAYFTKFAIDFLFLERILAFLSKRKYIWHMLPLQLVYVPYVVFTGIGGLFGRYHWKGRSIRNS
ncbi:cellulose synthase/poly-beta-1,6-N-acetylglucosamine synthase-like glycosyltransferase [Pontibacter aydingkolensis]|uniref:Glycosyltransferase n=2 Tax=Pontibacter aydingkolensis TaxID=1911536 RepID=A0ABS7CW42_9BACT|nr:glycosyltransferase [Pontibacter aydingkolensis]